MKVCNHIGYWMDVALVQNFIPQNRISVCNLTTPKI